MTTQSSLLSDIEAFLSESKMGPTYFGYAAVGNSKLVENMRAGKPIRMDTAERITKFIQDRRAGVVTRWRPTKRAPDASQERLAS